MGDFNDNAYMSHVLNMLGQSDSATIKAGEKLLKPFLNKKESILILINFLKTTEQGPQFEIVRFNAATFLKKKIATHFPKLQHVIGELKVNFLELMITETTKSSRVALAGATAALAKVVLSLADWPELFQVLIQLASNPSEQLRSLTFSLLEQLSEQTVVVDKLIPHTATLVQMFLMGCADPNTIVSIASMKSTSSYIRAIANKPDVMQLQAVLTPMLTVMNQCLVSEDTDSVVTGLDVLQECVELEQPLLNDHLEIITPFLINIMSNEELDDGIRQSAGQTLICFFQSRPKLLAKKNLVEPVLTALMMILAKDDSSAAGSLFSFAYEDKHVDDEDDEDYNPDKVDIQRLVQSCIDQMAISLPSKYFVQPALNLCSQGISSSDFRMRKAGCAVIGVIAEGCCDAIKERLSEILPPLLQSVTDAEFSVRECACFALGQFSEYCQPDILHFHAHVLPVIFAALDDPRPTVQGTTCYALEMFCENLQPETLRPFLNELMNKLAVLLESPQKLTKEMALSAIAATAVASEKDFLPFTNSICSLLVPLLSSSEPDLFQLRGRALECLGHIAVAVGRENFTPYFNYGLQSAIQALQFEDDTLQEHSYVFFANGAKVMTNEFNVHLASLVPHLLEFIEKTGLQKHVDGEDDEDGEFEDEDSEGGLFYVEEGFINSKKSALTAIGALAEHTKESFYPYMRITLEKLLTKDTGAVFSDHVEIRGEAISIMTHILTSVCSANKFEEIVKGTPIPLPPIVAEISKVIMETCMLTMELDEEKSPVALSCECISGVLDQVGFAGLSALTNVDNQNQPILNRLMAIVLELLNEKAKCQIGSKVEEYDDDEDHDNIVIDAVSDLIGMIAKSVGGDFMPYFDVIGPSLIKYADPKRVYTDRSMALGCFAEVIQEIGEASFKYVPTLLPFVKAGLSDTMESVRRNSAFCVGVMIQSCKVLMRPHYPSLLQALHPLCARSADKMSSDTGGADVDNALSAVSRMILESPDSLPLEQIFPVILAALPLRSDHTEGPVVYGCLIEMLKTQNIVAVSMSSQILDALRAMAVPNGSCSSDTQALCASYLGSI
jgi:hypothetical protein